MSYIYIFSDDFNGFSTNFLDLLSVVAIISGIFIIITKNPIVSVLFLILLFASISCYLISIGIKFIGISYLLVYVGAVSILFLFILMLINIRVSELISDTNNNIPLAVIIIIAFFIPYSNIVPNNQNDLIISEFNQFFNNSITSDHISFVTSYNWDSNLVDITDIISIGNVMYTTHSIWLLITSIILLLAMVGSIVITIKQKN